MEYFELNGETIKCDILHEPSHGDLINVRYKKFPLKSINIRCSKRTVLLLSALHSTPLELLHHTCLISEISNNKQI